MFGIKSLQNVWTRIGPGKRDKVEDYWYSPKSLLQKVSSVSFEEEASSSSQSRQLAWGTEIIKPLIESFAWSSQHMHICLCSQFLTSTPSCVNSAVGDGRDTHEMVCRILVTAQNFWPGVAITAHDWCTAVSNRFTQTPAGWYKPDKEEMEKEHREPWIE